jgi:hypothetical protein
MASRLLTAIDKRIAKTRDPLENTCLRAERAALLARQGHLEEARAELASVHARFDTRPNARVSAWTSLAEGLVIYFASLGVGARDKLKRSLALGQAINDVSLEAISAAWLAQLDFAVLDLDSMVQHVALSLRTAGATQHSALSRSSLVAAEAFHWAERLDLALPWYNRARYHATAEGDEPTLSAIMHNMAWMRAAAARRLSVSGGRDLALARQVKLGADSIGHFDELIDMEALSSLVPVLRAQVLTLNERYAEALEVFETHLPASIADGLERMTCLMLADTAWCRLRTADLDGARCDAAAAAASIVATTHIDDVAMTHSRLAAVYGALAEPDLASEHSSKAEAAWRTHSERQAHLITELGKALESQ